MGIMRLSVMMQIIRTLVLVPRRRMGLRLISTVVAGLIAATSWLDLRVREWEFSEGM